MDASAEPVAIEPLAAAYAPIEQPERTQILQLTIDRPVILSYLRNIAPDKVEVALLHALEVGIAALQARRAEFRKRTGDPQ